MKVSIREYRESDFRACRSLWEELTQHHRDIYQDSAIGGGDPGGGFETYMADPRRRGTWVAEVEGRVVGLTGLLVQWEEEGEVEPVVVSSSHRDRGIGSMLVERVVEEARKRGVRFLSIRPAARNERVVSLYVRLGFNLLGYVDLLQDLSPSSDRKWKPGIRIHGNDLHY